MIALSKKAAFIVCLAALTAVCFYAAEVSAGSKVSNKEIRKFFNRSCFIGNSVMVGRMNYVKAHEKKHMKKALALARVSYSFSNDKNKNHGFMIKYKGVEMQARNDVKKSKRKYVFIGTGTNDIFGGVSSTYKKYVSFIKGIKKTNPKATIFVESLTPIRKGKGALNNKNINKLNKKMKKYARTHKKVYYINVSSVLKDKSGRLKSEYSSDNYVHMTAGGYKKWNDVTKKYVRNMLKLKKENKWDSLRGGRKKASGKKNKNSRKTKKAVKKKLVRWDKSKKKLYFNTGEKVRGVAFYKGKFYAFTDKTNYRKKFTKNLRRNMKFTKDCSKLLKLLGKPKKSVYRDSCYDPDGNGKDGLLTYKLFRLTTYRDADGKEILLDVESRY